MIWGPILVGAIALIGVATLVSVGLWAMTTPFARWH